MSCTGYVSWVRWHRLAVISQNDFPWLQGHHFRFSFLATIINRSRFQVRRVVGIELVCKRVLVSNFWDNIRGGGRKFPGHFKVHFHDLGLQISSESFKQALYFCNLYRSTTVLANEAKICKPPPPPPPPKKKKKKKKRSEFHYIFVFRYAYL